MKTILIFLCILTAIHFPARAHEPIRGTFVSGPTLSRDTYDYAACGFFDGIFRQWWCSGVVAGDHIMYSQSQEPAGPWSPEYIVFGPTWSPYSFDGAHTCDPTMLRINGLYLMYYGGHPTADSPLPQRTAVGAAWSFFRPDHFTRVFSEPLVATFNPNDNARPYGAGQPSAIWLDGWVYLFFSDSSAPGSNKFNGGSVYCIRSTDGFFKSNVQELTANGFEPRVSTSHLTREHSLWDAYSVDVQFIDSIDQFVMVINGIENKTSFRFFDKNLRYLSKHDIDVDDIPWREGAGFVRDAHGHALPHGTGRNDRMSLVWYYPTGGTEPETWDVHYAGLDIRFTE